MNLHIVSQKLTIQEYAQALVVWEEFAYNSLSPFALRAYMGRVTSDDLLAWEIETDTILLEEV